MRRASILMLLGTLSVFFFLGASIAAAQSADMNSGGATKNDYRLRVVEPAEGATITGTTVRVTVANAIPQSTQPGSRTSDMPMASYRVYLGNTLKGELKRDETVLTIDNVAVGSQKLVVEALNVSGEVIGRKEINFQTIARTADAAMPPVPAADAKPATSSASSTLTTTTATNPPPANAYAAGPDEKALPHTASSAPRAALAGFGLILVGLLVSRKATR